MKGARVISVVAAIACAFAAHARDIVLVTTGNTPPYTYIDSATGEIKGIEIDIARAAAEALSRKLVVRRVDFRDLLPMVSEGRADMAAATITITDGRRQTVDFSIPYATEGGAFLYRAGEPMTTMIRAESLRVAVVDSSTSDFYLVAHGIDPVRYASFPEAVADLVSDRVDAIFFDVSGVAKAAEASGGALAVSRLETRENFGFAVGKDDGELKKTLDGIIARRRGISSGRRRRGRKEAE